MLDKELIKVMSKIYRHDNYEYDLDKKTQTYRIPDNFTEKQKINLKKIPFELNRIKEYRHNTLVQELKIIIKENLNLEYIVSNLFIKAVGSGFHRGLQPIFSYYFAKNIPDHNFEPLVKEGYATEHICGACGIKDKVWENDSKNLYDLYIGYCCFGGYSEILLDLKEVLTFNNIVATPEEIAIFSTVIDLIENAETNETFSTLKNRLSKEKCLPKSNNTSRVWFVKCLAELGILRNKYGYSIMNKFVRFEQKFEWEIAVNSKGKNYLEFPISAWRGNLGVNREIVNRIITNAHRISP